MQSIQRFLEDDDHEGHDHEVGEHDLSEVDSDAKGNITGIKVLIIVLLLLAGLFVFFPYTQVRPKKEGEKKKQCCKGRFFSISNCFAAGMLFSMALCHILPEAEAMYQAL